MTTTRPVLLIAVPLLACIARASLAAPTIKEQEVAPPWKPGTVLTLSQRGMHVASTHAKDNGKWVVQIDGVESPEYDEVLKAVPYTETVFADNGDVLSYTVAHLGPVAFSPDGKRHAYAERTGEDVVVIVDGREAFRAKQSPSAPPVQMLQFTPDGNHVYFFRASGDTTTSVMLMMDGKPASPALDAIRPLMFSADGAHWVLSAGAAKQPATNVVVVDGKTADYNCESARISRDGRHIACFTRASTLPAGHGRGVLVDGKLTVSGTQMDLLKFSPSGDVFATVKDAKNIATLYRNGSLVEGSEGALTLAFSPKGAHWAAKGMSGLGVARWVMYDGKKQKDYKEVSDVMFAADESAWAYFARSDQGWHVVVNGMERQPNAFAHGAMFAKTGHAFVYATGPAAMQVFLNDAPVSAPFKSVFGLELSPDGAHSGFYTTLGGLAPADLVVDGQAKSQNNQYHAGQRIGFSPDSKHVFATALHPQLKIPTIYLDGVFLPRAVTGLSPQEFTPDNAHLILTGQGPVEQGLTPTLYYVDGDLAAKCSIRAMPWMNSPKMIRPKVGVLPWAPLPKPIDPEAKDWEVEPDGSIVFICNTPAPGGYGAIKKVTVTPAAGATFATWAASLK